VSTVGEGDVLVTSTFNPDDNSWSNESTPANTADVIANRVYTVESWDAGMLSLGPALAAQAESVLQAKCDSAVWAGIRVDQLRESPSANGVVNDEFGNIWRGCDQGFVYVDVQAGEASFLPINSGAPTVIFDVLAAQDGLLFVHSNLGLGILNPETDEWTLVRATLVASDAADYDVWNSAVWIDDKIYFLEAKTLQANGLAWQERDARLWLYDVSDKSIREVTPDPQTTLQEAYFRVPSVIKPTSNGESLHYKSGDVVYIFTPSVPNPHVAASTTLASMAIPTLPLLWLPRIWWIFMVFDRPVHR